MQKKKIRVLCLHGWGTNSNIMNSQTKKLQEAFGGSAEFVFLDGPILLKEPTDRVIQHHFPHEKKLFKWFDDFPHTDEELDEKHKDWILGYTNIDDTISYCDEKLRHMGAFDIMIGFSQGATFGACMTAYYLKKGIMPWKCFIAVCAVRVRCLKLRELFETSDGIRNPLKIPSIHIIGKKDPMYPESHGFVSHFAGKHEGISRTVFLHDQGHKFPSKNKFPTIYAETVRLALEACQERPAPSQSRL
jgi:predicted esterase